MSLTVFSKHVCTYCQKAKAVLDTKPHIQVTYIYLDDQADPDRAREHLMQLMGLPKDAPRPTVPQFFFGEEYVPGGATALLQLQDTHQLDVKLNHTPRLPKGTFPPNTPDWTWKRVEYDPDDF
jgi:glutaredoxin